MDRRPRRPGPRRDHPAPAHPLRPAADRPRFGWPETRPRCAVCLAGVEEVTARDAGSRPTTPLPHAEGPDSHDRRHHHHQRRRPAHDLTPGVYEVTLTDISEPRTIYPQTGPNAGKEVQLRDWTFALEDGSEVTGSACTSSGPKSKTYAWLTALLGGTPPAVGTGYPKSQLLGREALATIAIDEGGWAKIANLSARPKARAAAPVAAAPRRGSRPARGRAARRRRRRCPSSRDARSGVGRGRCDRADRAGVRRVRPAGGREGPGDGARLQERDDAPGLDPGSSSRPRPPGTTGSSGRRTAPSASSCSTSTTAAARSAPGATACSTSSRSRAPAAHQDHDDALGRPPRLLPLARGRADPRGRRAVRLHRPLAGPRLPRRTRQPDRRPRVHGGSGDRDRRPAGRWVARRCRRAARRALHATDPGAITVAGGFTLPDRIPCGRRYATSATTRPPATTQGWGSPSCGSSCPPRSPRGSSRQDRGGAPRRLRPRRPRSSASA